MNATIYSTKEWEQIKRFSETQETPFLVVLQDRIRQKFETFRAGFPNAKVYYAVKANPGTEVLVLLRDLGIWEPILISPRSMSSIRCWPWGCHRIA
ncbi:hypothetical protein CCP4SC76_1710005 [Gammaproteobacteria bacterium]